MKKEVIARTWVGWWLVETSTGGASKILRTAYALRLLKNRRFVMGDTIGLDHEIVIMNARNLGDGDDGMTIWRTKHRERALESHAEHVATLRLDVRWWARIAGWFFRLRYGFIRAPFGNIRLPKE